MKAKLAYLTTPAPGVYVLNLQTEGSPDWLQYEITKAHLANIIIDGAALSLRENRVPATASHENANGSSGAQFQGTT